MERAGKAAGAVILRYANQWKNTGVGEFGQSISAVGMGDENVGHQLTQALAQAMMNEGMTPINPNRSAGRFAVPINPLEGAAKMAQAYLGTKMQQHGYQEQADIARRPRNRPLRLRRRLERYTL